MQNNTYVTLEMRLINKRNGLYTVDKENCDIYGNPSNNNKMNLFNETIKTNFLNEISGFYLERIEHSKNKETNKKELWVLDSYPHSLKYIENNFGNISNIYRSALGYQINNGSILFVLKNDFSDVIPIEKELLIITSKENFSKIIDDISTTVNQNNNIRHSISKTKSLYKRR